MNGIVYSERCGSDIKRTLETSQGELVAIVPAGMCQEAVHNFAKGIARKQLKFKESELRRTIEFSTQELEEVRNRLDKEK